MVIASSFTSQSLSVILYANYNICLYFQYDGINNGDDIPYVVDLVNSGSIIIPDFDIPIMERFFVPDQRELLYVPGSNTAVMFVWGR